MIDKTLVNHPFVFFVRLSDFKKNILQRYLNYTKFTFQKNKP